MKIPNETPGRSHSKGHRGRGSVRKIGHTTINRTPIKAPVSTQSAHTLELRARRRLTRPRLTFDEICKMLAKAKCDFEESIRREKQRKLDEQIAKAAEKARLATMPKADMGYRRDSLHSRSW